MCLDHLRALVRIRDFSFHSRNPHSVTHRRVRQIVYGNSHLVAGSTNKLAVDFLNFYETNYAFNELLRFYTSFEEKYLKVKSKQFIKKT